MLGVTAVVSDAAFSNTVNASQETDVEYHRTSKNGVTVKGRSHTHVYVWAVIWSPVEFLRVPARGTIKLSGIRRDPQLEMVCANSVVAEGRYYRPDIPHAP